MDDKRIVVLLDMDCFYCQVEEKLNPNLKGKPIAVVQYNPWKGGGIIAVNYIARAMGVTRHMRGDEAREKCPEIHLPSVPCQRGKADISKYREAGKEVALVLQKFTSLVERASIDEAYLDITEAVEQRSKSLAATSITPSLLPNTFALGYDSIDQFINDVCFECNDHIDFEPEHSRRLLVGMVVVSEIRRAVFDETGYQCSAGIAHNKILAKLVCGMNKPNKQTVLAKHCVSLLYSTLPLKKVKHLGGKFGDNVCSVLKINKMGELLAFTEKELQRHFDEQNGSWLYNIARGIDTELVQAKFNPKSIGCCKNFKGKNALLDHASLIKWLNDLGEEIEERLEKDALENNRTPKQMVVSFALEHPNGRDVSSSRSYNFSHSDFICGELLSKKALELMIEAVEPEGYSEINKFKLPVKFLGISVGKFEDNDKKSKKIMDYFAAGSSKENISNSEKSEKNQKLQNAKSDLNEENINNLKTKADENKKIFGKKQESNLSKNTEPKRTSRSKSPILSSLDKQESFFKRFLYNALDDRLDEQEAATSHTEGPSTHPPTPDCNIIEHNDDSSSDHSGSTIEMEINQSKNLFDSSPKDTERVINTRKMMSTSLKLDNDILKSDDEDTIIPDEVVQPHSIAYKHETIVINETLFKCTICNKMIPEINNQMHADYHLALQLRDEEKIHRKNVVEKENELKESLKNSLTKKSLKKACSENYTLKKFFHYYENNESMEKCSECGKKLPVSKLPEHLDFHEAQKLSRILNKKSAVIPSTPKGVKRKRIPSPTKKSKIACKPINSFFNS